MPNQHQNISADLNEILREDGSKAVVSQIIGIAPRDISRYRIHFELGDIGKWLDLRRLRTGLSRIIADDSAPKLNLSGLVRLSGVRGIQPVIVSWCVNQFVNLNVMRVKFFIKLLVEEVLELSSRHQEHLTDLWTFDHGADSPLPWRRPPPCHAAAAPRPPPTGTVPDHLLEEDELDWRPQEFDADLIEFLSLICEDRGFAEHWVKVWLTRRFQPGSFVPFRMLKFPDF